MVISKIVVNKWALRKSWPIVHSRKSLYLMPVAQNSINWSESRDMAMYRTVWRTWQLITYRSRRTTGRHWSIQEMVEVPLKTLSTRCQALNKSTRCKTITLVVIAWKAYLITAIVFSIQHLLSLTAPQIETLMLEASSIIMSRQMRNHKDQTITHTIMPSNTKS